MEDVKKLAVLARERGNGLALKVEGKTFGIEYPRGFWRRTPREVRRVLRENIAYAETHWLPLILKRAGAAYDTPLPLFEPLFFKNQLYDLLFCETVDKAEQLSYLRHFYNLEFLFSPRRPASPVHPKSAAAGRITKHPTAVVPFTFGKESLATVGLCLELGLRPALVYVEEPVQPYEKRYKLKTLSAFKKEFGTDYFFLKHAPGEFRYGRAFGLKKASEIGWGTQVSLLTLLVTPFVYSLGARYVLYGNEYSNNERERHKGWKVYPSADQTTHMTGAQDAMMRVLSGGRAEVKSTLEPLEEINIFYLLHHRYPALGRYQFSCFAERPLYPGSQWCHRCHKCMRMYLFSQALGFDSSSLGFREDLLKNLSLWRHYFGGEVKTGSSTELDFAFYLLHRRGDKSRCVTLFRKQKLPRLKSWSWYRNFFTDLKPAENLPAPCRRRLIEIFHEELKAFKKILL